MSFPNRRHRLACHRNDVARGRLLLEELPGSDSQHAGVAQQEPVHLHGRNLATAKPQHEQPALRCQRTQAVGHPIAPDRVEDDVYTGPYVYITDQNHGYSDPQVPIGKQWPINAPVSIGAGSWLGTGAVVLPGATIGRNVVVAAGSVVRGNIPDHCVVGGVPARVIRRYSGDGEGVPADEAARLGEVA